MIGVDLNQFSLVVDLVIAMCLSLNETCRLVLHVFKSTPEAIIELCLGHCSFEQFHFVLQKLYFHLCRIALRSQAIQLFH